MNNSDLFNIEGPKEKKKRRFHKLEKKKKNFTGDLEKASQDTLQA